MKHLIIIILFAFTSVAKCQPNTNIITSTEYENIKINNIKIADIRNTLGKSNAIESLFGTSTSKNIDQDGDFYNYNFNGFTISFSSIISDGTHDKPIISRFEITNNNAKIIIKGIPITIGDKIEKLGDVTFNTNNDNSKSILYMECDGCNNFISIEFNQSTNIITKIEYIELT